ncbi:MAG: 4-hydroxy-tetrahydrodipicolinate synthase [Chloroflexota bacterium]
MRQLGRLITAMVTPFDDYGRVDYEQAKRLALALINSGSDGLAVSGSTGEAPALTRDEKLKLFAEVKEAVRDRGTVIAGTGTYSTRESVELTKEAENAGVDAILIVAPCYSRPPQEGLYQHFKAVAMATSLPCIPYNVPSRTAVNLAPHTVIRLNEIDNIVGIKEASGNLNQIATIIGGAGKDFLVYSGNDSDTLPVLAVGGYGVISVISHLVGRQVKEMMERFLRGEKDEASAMHRHLLSLNSAMFVVSNPIPTKYALNYLGFRVGKPRLPLTDPDEQSAAFIRSTLREHRIDLPLEAKV